MGYRVDITQVVKGLSEAKLKTMFAIEKYGQAAAQQLEAKAKTGAPWTDRTGLARQTISHFAEWQGEAFRVGIAGNMEYSVYLELRFEERFAILWPTIHASAAEILQGLQGIIK